MSRGEGKRVQGISARQTDEDMDRETCARHSLGEIKKPMGKRVRARVSGSGKKTWEYNDREAVY